MNHLKTLISRICIGTGILLSMPTLFGKETLNIEISISDVPTPQCVDELQDEDTHVHNAFVKRFPNDYKEIFNNHLKGIKDFYTYISSHKNSYIPFTLNQYENFFSPNQDIIDDYYFQGEKKALSDIEKELTPYARPTKNESSKLYRLTQPRLTYEVYFCAFTPGKRDCSYSSLKALHLKNKTLISEETRFILTENEHISTTLELDHLTTALLRKLTNVTTDESKLALVNEYQKLASIAKEDADKSLFIYKKEIPEPLAKKLEKVMFLFKRSNSAQPKLDPPSFFYEDNAFSDLFKALSLNESLHTEPLCFLYGYQNEIFGISAAPLSILNSQTILEKIYVVYNAGIMYTQTSNNPNEEKRLLNKMESFADSLIRQLKKFDH